MTGSRPLVSSSISSETTPAISRSQFSAACLRMFRCPTWNRSYAPGAYPTTVKGASEIRVAGLVGSLFVAGGPPGPTLSGGSTWDVTQSRLLRATKKGTVHPMRGAGSPQRGNQPVDRRRERRDRGPVGLGRAAVRIGDLEQARVGPGGTTVPGGQPGQRGQSRSGLLRDVGRPSPGCDGLR